MKVRRRRLETILIHVCVALAIFGRPSEQKPLCRSEADDCDEEERDREQPGEELPSFSSRYRALEYDETIMKLLMEMLLEQHNSFTEEDAPISDFEDSENSNSEVDDDINQSFPPTESFLSGIINGSQYNRPIATVKRPEHHSSPSNQIGEFLHLHQNQVKSKANNAISKAFKELSSVHETPEQLLSIVDKRFGSIPPAQAAELINMQTFIEGGGIQDSGKQVAAPITTKTTQPTSDSSVSIRNMLSSKYKDTKRISKLNGPHSILLRPRPFDGFTETETLPLPTLNYREHFIRPTTKPKEKINSLESADRDQDVRGENQFAILNRPISASKPMTTPSDVGVGIGCGNATSCRLNNKKPVQSIKVKIGQKPAKMMTKATTTKGRGIFGKPSGIRFPNSNPNSVSVAATSPVSGESDGNLISGLASTVDSGENDAEDSEEAKAIRMGSRSS